MNNHIAGPWKAYLNSEGNTGQNNESWISCDKPGQDMGKVVCVFENDCQELMTENARLIAAAPDLLETCKNLVSLLVSTEYAFNPAVVYAKTTIDNATGE